MSRFYAKVENYRAGTRPSARPLPREAKQPAFWGYVNRDAYVYFIHSNGLIKIGTTANTDWRTRIDRLRTTNASIIETLVVINGGRGVEQGLHQLFAGHRHHGEWFNLPDGWMRTVHAVIDHLGLEIVYTEEDS